MPSSNIFSTLSEEQRACVEHVKTSRQSLIINALAGSGKTYCLEAIMVAINQTYPDASIAVLSFNASIAEELKAKVAKRGIFRCHVGTAHKFGKTICEHELKKRFVPNKFKLSDILKEFCPKRFGWPEQMRIIQFAEICKNVGVGKILEFNYETLLKLIDYYDVVIPEKKISEKEFIDLTLQLLQRSAENAKTLDLSDLIWMPLIHGWQAPNKYDFIIVDEAQDINACRLALIKSLAKDSTTVIAAGDRHQAIYGFTGADVKAIDNIATTFNAKELQLTYTRRCSKAVVAHAQKIVPSIKHLPEAIEGSVSKTPYPAFTQRLRVENHETSAVLCRKNAPLFGLALELIKNKIPCRMEGTELQARLKTIIKNLDATDIPSLREKLAAFEAEKSKKLSSYRFAELSDQITCIKLFATISSTIPELLEKINTLFAPANPFRPVLTLSSIHKSKGLEWPTVFLLGRNAWMPSPFATQPWMQIQEDNLTYVAITRAKAHLVEVLVND